MKLIITLIILIIPAVNYALTLEEATRYGSRIIICKGEFVKYWTLNKKYQHAGTRSKGEYQVFDSMKKKFYSLDDCSLYKCSPAPDRMYKCIQPDK